MNGRTDDVEFNSSPSSLREAGKVYQVQLSQLSEMSMKSESSILTDSCGCIMMLLGHTHWAIPFFVRTPPMDGVGFPAGFFFVLHYGRFWIFHKNCNIIHTLHWILRLCDTVKGMDGLGFLEKYVVSSIPLSDFSNMFFLRVWIFF